MANGPNKIAKTICCKCIQNKTEHIGRLADTLWHRLMHIDIGKKYGINGPGAPGIDSFLTLM
jgi:hypothetical protein